MCFTYYNYTVIQSVFGGKAMKKFSTVPFRGTHDQEAEMKAWLQEHKDVRGVAMPALQKAQDIYGYLPIEVLQMIADELQMPMSELYGIATFYAQFALCPKGSYAISVCLGTACYVKGSGDLMEELKKELKIDADECTPDGRFSLTACRCIGACGLAPVLTVNGEVYGRLTTKDIPGILAKYQG